MLCHSGKPFRALLLLIEWLFKKCTQRFEVDSNYFITAECMGISAFVGQ